MDNQEPEGTPGKQPSALEMDPPVKRNPMVFVVGALAVSLILLLAIKSKIRPAMPTDQAKVEVVEGATLPDIELTKLDGSKVSLSQLKHKVILLNFWATWCEACMTEMPSLIKLREKYSKDGFEILGINLDNNPDNAVPPVQKKLGMTFPIFKDESGNIGDMFDVHAIPLSLVLNKDRTILYTYSGDQDWNSEEVFNLVEQWLGMKPPSAN